MNTALAALDQKEKAQIRFWMAERGVTEKGFRRSMIFGGIFLGIAIFVSLYTAVITVYGLSQITSGFEAPGLTVWVGPLLGVFILGKVYTHTPHGRFTEEKRQLASEISGVLQPGGEVPLDPASIRIYADQILKAAIETPRFTDLYFLFSGFCDLEKVEGV